MPQLIKSNRLSGLRPVFTDNLENYKRYIQIRKKFEKNNMYRIFAEPKLDHLRKEAEWYTEWEGQMMSFDAWLAAHPQIPREELESSVKTEVNRLFAECAKYKDSDPEYRALNETLVQCIEIPDVNDIYIIQLPGGEQKYILCNWGFISDAFDAETGIVQRMQVLNLLNLRLTFRYPGGQPAAGEKIFTVYNNQTAEFTTDNNGEFVINRFPGNTSLSLYQIDAAGQKANVHNIPEVTQDHLELTIRNLKEADHVFIFKDAAGKEMSGLPVTFRINNVDQTATTDAGAKVILPGIADQSAVECYYTGNGKTQLLDSFRSNLLQLEHVIQVPEGLIVQPPVPETPKEITLHFIDKKKADVADLPVNLSFPTGATANFTTDAGGKFTLQQPPHGSRIRLSAIRDKIRWKGSFKSDKDKNYYLFIFKKRSRWWLWLILGLLLLLALLLAAWLLRGCLRDMSSPLVDNNIQVGNTEILVVDDADSKPIAGAMVTLSCGTYNQQDKTGASGKVTFNSIPSPTASKPMVVYASKSGYGDERQEFTYAKNKITIRMKKIGDGGLVGKRGQFNVNLQWYTTDDLDLVITDPCGNMIYFKDKKKSCGSATGVLDVDANFDKNKLTVKPQENIVWEKVKPGQYSVYVVFYEQREKPAASCKVTIFKGNRKEEIYKTIEYTGNRELVLIKTVVN